MGRMVGLIRGLSFESEEAYARLDLKEAGRSGSLPGRGGLISRSLDRGLVWDTFRDSGWPGVGELALEAARTLQRAGAELVGLAGCAGHKIAETVEAGTGLPLLHIADPLGREMARRGLTRLGLLGARFTLSDGHLRDRLKDEFALRVLVPEPADIEIVQAAIHQELLKDKVREESRMEVGRIIGLLEASGAQAVVLAFSDLARLIGPRESSLPVLETTSLHAAALARAAED